MIKTSRIKARCVGLTAALGLTSIAASASAHVSLASGPGFATTTQEITFGVGHGCAGADTVSVRVEIPPSVSSVRVANNNLGKATVETDATTGSVKAVTWQKPDTEVLASDVNYYQLSLRIKVPDMPFATVVFPAYQTCRSGTGVVTTVKWTATSEPSADAGADAPEIAPQLLVLPKRQTGWNKYTVPVAVADLNAVFGDALIVWKDAAAFSTNAVTKDLIAATPGVTKLTALAPGDVVWVKY